MWNLRTTTSAIGAVFFALSLGCATGNSQTKPNPPAPPAGLEVLWQQKLDLREKVEGPESAKIAPWLAVGESLLFLASESGGLTAHSPDDGHVFWSSERMSAAPPVTAAGYVAIVSNGALEVLRQETSELVWRAAVDAPVSAIFAFGDRFGVVAGPEIRTWDRTGAAGWRTSLGGAAATAVVFRNGALFVGLDEPALVAIDATTGAVRWRAKLPAKPESLAASDERLYWGGADAFLYSYLTSGESSRKWKYEMVRAIGQAVVDDRSVYFSLLDNSVRAFDREGGSQRWAAVMPDRPMVGPIQLGTSLAVALRSGQVVELAAKDGQVRQPAVPAKLQEATLQAAVASHDGERVFTVTTAADYSRHLTAWGRPVKR